MSLYRVTDAVVEVCRGDKNRNMDSVHDYRWCDRLLCYINFT